MANRAAKARAKTLATYPDARLAGRTRDGLVYEVGPNRFRGSFSPDLHYRDDQGAWRETDTTPADRGDRFENTTLPFRVDIGKDMSRIFRFRTGETLILAAPEIQRGRGWETLTATPARTDDKITWQGDGWQVRYRYTPTGVKASYVAEGQRTALPVRWPYVAVGCEIVGDEVRALDGRFLASLKPPRLKGRSAMERRAIPVTVTATHLEYTPDYRGFTFPIEVDPTINESPGVGEDDGRARQETGGDWGDADEPVVGDFGRQLFGWFRIPGCTITIGATIDAADMDLVGTGAEAEGPVLSQIYGVDEDDHVAPTSYSEWQTDHGLHTTAVVAWNFNSSDTQTSFTTPDFASVIQELSDRPGRNETFDIGIHLDDNGTEVDSDIFQAFGDVDGGNPAVLNVEFTAGGTPVGATVELDWSARAAVGDAVEVDWTVASTIGDPVELDWGTAASVGDATSIEWAVLSAVTDSMQAVWAVHQLIGDALDIDWQTFAAIADTLDVDWATLLSAGDQVEMEWPVRAAAGDSLDLDWSAAAAAGESLDIVWVVTVSIGDTIEAVWSVATNVGDAIEADWTVNALVADAAALEWDTAAAIADAVALEWDVLESGTVGDTIGLQWSAREAVSDSANLLWNTLEVAADSVGLDWQVATTIGDLVAFDWSIRETAGEALQLVWDVDSEVSPTFWQKDPAGFEPDPAGFTRSPAGYQPALAGDPSPFQ